MSLNLSSHANGKQTSKHTHTRGNIQRGVWLVLAVVLFAACSSRDGAHPYQDVTHFSKTFGREKYYRLYLPESYQHDTATRYPVVYFFHGWGGRHSSDDNAKLAYDSLQKLVDKYNVLLVMWDGNVDEKEPRPYNTGSHSDVRYQVQMKDYFPELVNHIDSAYRTLADKQYRGIIGFSMGGFMSYYLSGKFPEMVRAAVGMTGSPEFFLGYPGQHTLYPLRYAFENLREVKLRFHNSTADELTYLNSEVKDGAAWDGKVSFDYWQFEGGHVVDLPGETRVFEKALSFVVQAFDEPVLPTIGWSHYDLYPEFSVYGYDVKTNLRRSGFTYLKHVSPGGFGIGTTRWLPDGPPLDSVTVDLVTAPVYNPNGRYHVTRLNTATRRISEEDVTADGEGRLLLTFDGDNYEVAVASPAGNNLSGVIAFDYEMKNGQRFLRPGDNQLQLQLFDRDGSRLKGVYDVTVTPTDSAVRVTGPAMQRSNGARVVKSNAVSIRWAGTPPGNAAPPFVKLHVAVTSGSVTNNSELIVPVMFDVPQFATLGIDDGRALNDSTHARGRGNGDGVVQAGERIAVYVDGRPLKLYSESGYVVREREEQFDIMVPAKWPDGFTMASVIQIDEKTPDGTEIELLGNYETKDFMPVRRQVHWGKVRIRVANKNVQ